MLYRTINGVRWLKLCDVNDETKQLIERLRKDGKRIRIFTHHGAFIHPNDVSIKKDLPPYLEGPTS